MEESTLKRKAETESDSFIVVDDIVPPETKRATEPIQEEVVCLSKASREGDYEMIMHAEIRSPHGNVYKIDKYLGKGTFGKVAAAENQSNEKVAIKIINRRTRFSRIAEKEALMWSRLSYDNPEKYNIVRAIESFYHQEHYCLVFELLEMNLRQYVKSCGEHGMRLNAIRPILHQVLIALEKLKSLGIIHGDLKGENIMLTDISKQNLNVKLIDFGLSVHRNDTDTTIAVGTLPYRSPESLLRHPFNEAVDIWALGCLICELFLGYQLYPGRNDYEQLNFIVNMQGMPSVEMIEECNKCDDFFTTRAIRKPYKGKNPYRLKTSEEYYPIGGGPTKPNEKMVLKKLEHMNSVKLGDEEKDEKLYRLDKREFIVLSKSMLELDPSKRITPNDALYSSFNTMQHIAVWDNIEYFKEAVMRMECCNRDSIPEEPIHTFQRHPMDDSYDSDIEDNY